jgi:hypothetical protein
MFLTGMLGGAGLAIVLVLFEYTSILREVAERAKRTGKKPEWDSNQKSRIRGMITFAFALTVGAGVGAWWVWG